MDKKYSIRGAAGEAALRHKKTMKRISLPAAKEGICIIEKSGVSGYRTILN
jgi:hypothetical protein